MKKEIWIVLGIVMVGSTVFLIGRNGAQERRSEQAAGSQEVSTGGNDVSPVSLLPDDEKSQQVGEGTEQGLQDAGDTIANPAPAISDAVRTLIGVDADYNARLEAMRNLARDISPEDIAALMEFLGGIIPDGLAMSPIEYNSIRNDVMEILLRQEQLPNGIGQLLTEIYNNPKQDEIWRNYSIQFMAPFYERQSNKAGGAGSSPANNELKLVEESLWKALDERDNSNAATALLGLDNLSGNFPEFEKSDVQAAMVDLATDDTASEANRITALRLCGQQGHVEALEPARDVAQHGETTLLRCAAIATLGDLGSDEDRDLLEAYAISTDKRIQQIALHSLKKLSND